MVIEALNFLGERYNLTSQIRRAALSITANVAEGFGRYHYKDHLKFLYDARGSLAEVKSHLYAAKNLKLMDEMMFNELYKMSEDLG